MMYRIVNVKDYSDGFEKAVQYIHGKWGNERNYLFYYDAIYNSSVDIKGLPKFYLMLKNNEIVGCYALLVNDLISRQDLLPWFACLFVEEQERGKQLSGQMFSHARIESMNAGFSDIYLTTDHDGFYEKYGWTRIEDGYNFFGEKSRIYKITTT